MTTYYVSTSGNNSSAGTSVGAAFATLQQAENVVQPGDVVKVESGTYTGAANDYGVLQIGKAGTSSAPITFEADTGATPVINSNGDQSGIRVDANYNTIQGFTIVGGAQSMNASTSQDYFHAGGVGVLIQGSSSAPVVGDVIQGNTVSYEPLSGIAVEGTTDKVQILGNTVHDNSWWSTAGGSGISVFGLVNSDGGPSTEVSAVVAGNVAYNNVMKVNETGYSSPIDGNGIIIDTTNSTGYNKTTLVENNLAYGNGGSGMHSVGSNNVEFLYNTAYNNNSTVPGRGQIAAFNDTGNVIENNVLDAGTNSAVINASGQTVDYNLYWDGNAAKVGSHDVVANPAFVNPSAGNFQLQGSSAAIDHATPSFIVGNDLAGAARPSGSGYDMGAYEYQQAASSPPPTPTSGPDDTLTVKLSEDAYQGNAQGTVSIDGKALGTETVTALHSQGAFQGFTFDLGHLAAGSHNVAIEFLNDAYGGSTSADRNLYVDQVQYDGTNFTKATVTGPYTSTHTSSLSVALLNAQDTATFSVTH